MDNIDNDQSVRGKDSKVAVVLKTGKKTTDGEEGHMQTARLYKMEDIEMTENITRENTDNNGSKWDQPKKGPDDNLSAGEIVKIGRKRPRSWKRRLHGRPLKRKKLTLRRNCTRRSVCSRNRFFD
jgi:hypothetical protein